MPGHRNRGAAGFIEQGFEPPVSYRGPHMNSGGLLLCQRRDLRARFIGGRRSAGRLRNQHAIGVRVNIHQSAGIHEFAGAVDLPDVRGNGNLPVAARSRIRPSGHNHHRVGEGRAACPVDQNRADDGLA